ncbi:hypothetical protein chiPu_0028535 [Chiloscyllium punctatum]|uniref:CCHC-type domain-containing protein n=1 Tax=Chiloscyllium punctatum TaxID=137246 RepID=A0A401TNY6_CHIPU|nr:hypothetical protein [Chiloscyllium punctatum]
MSLDNQAPATVAALSTPEPLVCHRCRQTGHHKFNCPLSFRHPGDPDLGGGSPSQCRDNPGQHRGRSPPRHADHRHPSRPSEQGTPKQGTNGDPRPQKLHEPRSPRPKPSPTQLGSAQLRAAARALTAPRPA